MKIKDLYNTLVQSLRLVASTYEVQVSVLPAFVCVPDEIALIFNEACTIAPQLKEENFISTNIFYLLEELDNMFEKMSEQKSFWTLKKLEYDETWERTRVLALNIMKELNEPYERPNLDFNNWVKE